MKEEHLRTSASVRYHFAIYCTYSALIHFTITCIYTDDDVNLYRRWRIFIQMMTCIYTDDNVSLYRWWATLWIVLLAIVLWEGIRKTTMKWKLAISDRNNDYFYKLTQTMFLTGFRKASYVYAIYSTWRNISQNTVRLEVTIFRTRKSRISQDDQHVPFTWVYPLLNLIFSPSKKTFMQCILVL